MMVPEVLEVYRRKNNAATRAREFSMLGVSVERINVRWSRMTYIFGELGLVCPIAVDEKGVRNIILGLLGPPDWYTGELPSNVYLTPADHAAEEREVTETVWENTRNRRGLIREKFNRETSHLVHLRQWTERGRRLERERELERELERLERGRARDLERERAAK
jgi:hypothetical protein